MTLGATKLEGEATRAGGRGLTWAGRIGIGLGVLGIGLSGLRGVPNLQSMGEAIEDATFPLLLERAKATLAEGGSVDFGDIRATPAGVQGFGLLGGTVAWDDVQGFGLGKHNRVALWEKGVPVAQNGPFAFEVPNLAVLFALA